MLIEFYVNNDTPWLNQSQNYQFATFLYKYPALQSYVPLIVPQLGKIASYQGKLTLESMSTKKLKFSKSKQ